MTPQEARSLIEPIFYMKEMEILERFANSSKDSIFTKHKQTDFSSVFIPGSRKDRVLLVAHVDTVWHDSPKIEVGYGNEGHEIFYSEIREKGLDKDDDPYFDGIGFGADDRAGVAMLWMYRQLGHSLLLVNGEERGTRGSRYLMSNSEMAAEIQEHQFAVEFDRHGYNDIVFYSVWTKSFKDYVANVTKYYPQPGTHTDICVLCRKICGVNISVGYYGEHGPNEVLDVNDWLNTYKVAGKWLSQKNLPKFPL